MRGERYAELLVSYWDHTKVNELYDLLGAERGCIAAAFNTWLWAQATRQAEATGVFGPKDLVESRVARYFPAAAGHVDELVTALVNVGLLERTEAGIAIHDWEDYGIAHRLSEVHCTECARSFARTSGSQKTCSPECGQARKTRIRKLGQVGESCVKVGKVGESTKAPMVKARVPRSSNVPVPGPVPDLSLTNPTRPEPEPTGLDAAQVSGFLSGSGPGPGSDVADRTDGILRVLADAGFADGQTRGENLKRLQLAQKLASHGAGLAGCETLWLYAKRSGKNPQGLFAKWVLLPHDQWKAKVREAGRNLLGEVKAMNGENQ